MRRLERTLSQQWQLQLTHILQLRYDIIIKPRLSFPLTDGHKFNRIERVASTPLFPAQLIHLFPPYPIAALIIHNVQQQSPWIAPISLSAFSVYPDPYCLPFPRVLLCTHSISDALFEWFFV